jgi:hypothetical protein
MCKGMGAPGCLALPGRLLLKTASSRKGCAGAVAGMVDSSHTISDNAEAVLETGEPMPGQQG